MDPLDPPTPPPPQQDPPSRATPSAEHGPDRLSVVLGNATLLGIGYMLMRRPRSAIVSLVGSVVLLSLIAYLPHVLAWRLLLPVWWAAVVAHTWWLAPRGRPLLRGAGKAAWRGRALTAACLLLVLFAWVRLDTWTIVRDAGAAHTDGDCERAVASLRWLGPAHSVAHAPSAARGEREREACELLLSALSTTNRPAEAEALREYLDHPGALWDGAGPERAELLLGEALEDGEAAEGAPPALAMVQEAFSQLSATLRSAPGQSERVRAVVESFLTDLVGAEPCTAKEIDAWLFAQTWEEPELAETTASQADQVPVRMFGCAEALRHTQVEASMVGYQEFLTAHPEHELAVRAAEALLSDGGYCDHPAAYPGAAAYEGGGPHAMWMSGLDPDDHGFPDSWQAATPDDTALVVCVEGPERGGYQETCYYEPGEDQVLPLYGTSVGVDFYASEFTVRAYELRTGELVEEYSEEIGDPCPDVLEYDSYYLDSVPSEYDSDYSDAGIRAVFDRLMD
ncbi:hypothetical protein ACFW53_04695 [Nocardiopsis dassonvillei]|uniref:hypothetical protein n=1 Tax=Nocardiopsis dassonvillei TaxID=2014 RepID=UPI00366C43AC